MENQIYKFIFSEIGLVKIYFLDNLLPLILKLWEGHENRVWDFP
jgi:hypothetical protein